LDCLGLKRPIAPLAPYVGPVARQDNRVEWAILPPERLLSDDVVVVRPALAEDAPDLRFVYPYRHPEVKAEGNTSR
jgi:hypothetical protein